MVRLGRTALVAATGDPHAGDGYTPDTALVNYYDDTARMGMHQDKDELSLAPVVSLSIGDTCQFRFGNTENRKQPYHNIDLASGDLFVFGGPPGSLTTGSPGFIRAQHQSAAASAAAGSISPCASQE